MSANDPLPQARGPYGETILNAMSHEDIILVNSVTKEPILRIPPCGSIAKVPKRRRYIRQPSGLLLSITEYSKPQGFPEYADDTLVVVSSEAFEALLAYNASHTDLGGQYAVEDLCRLHYCFGDDGSVSPDGIILPPIASNSGASIATIALLVNLEEASLN